MILDKKKPQKLYKKLLAWDKNLVKFAKYIFVWSTLTERFLRFYRRSVQKQTIRRRESMVLYKSFKTLCSEGSFIDAGNNFFIQDFNKHYFL